MAKRIRSGRREKQSWLIIPVVLIMICCVVPLIVMIIAAFKPSMALYKIPVDLNPFTSMNIKNFINAFKKVDFSRAFGNSLFYCFLICLITVMVGLTGGYAFAKRKFRGKNVLFAILMATMMLPRQVMMIPNYLVAQNLGLTTSYWGYILTSISSAYAIFMCRQFMKTIPDDLLEAARIDGCGENRMFFQIVMPLSLPIASALTIFTFISTWNDFIWQNIMLSGKKNMTVSLALAYLEGQSDVLNAMGNKMAGATLSAVPMILVFILCQKYFIKGISAGAVKE